ncbi:fibronectin type III domain-containing protein [Sphaerisporangium album]|uniref:Fibronectin type III domain-containing protein n=1 Tax=Sphaerisporangium album TaxID=509200 RepID=A0A367FGI7_9ACTN|nr:fibronectin type III domain-containing protein [Sphaerisporangium album]RCG29414.1 fibronectin type III domain-containing protein [Sphaerisporangium album]
MDVPKPRGDRLTGVIAAVVVGALGVTAALVGVGVSSASPRLADIGAWLWSSHTGSVVHANGLSGKVDGRIDKVAGAGRDLDIVQDGTTVLLVDRATGAVSRIEPSRLTIVQTRDFKAARLQVVVAGDAAYAVDPEGTVQRIDPATLNAVGAPVTLPRPLGRAAFDGGGTLWVPVPARGQVVPIHGGVKGREVPAGDAGDPLSLTVAGGLPVVVNTRAANAVTIGADGTRSRFTLPEAVTSAGHGGVLSPAMTEGSTVPLLVPGPDGLLLLLDSASGQIAQTKLAQVVDDPSALGVPQVLGSRAYIPDTGSGRLIVWDAAAKGFVTPIQVTKHKGDFEVFVRDGLLWANEGDGAVVVDPEGREQRVQKDDPDVPGPTRTPRPEPTPSAPPTDDGSPPPSDPPVSDPTGRDPTPTRSRDAVPPEATPTPERTRTRGPSPTASPTPSAPGAPGSVSVQSGPGRIDVTFSPSAGGRVDHYTLTASAPGGDVTPARVGGKGPFRFQVTGGDCAKEYTFVVVAHWKGGEVSSEPSGAAKPCVAPAAPANFRATPKNHGADLSWDAPGNARGSDTTYSLSGAAAKDGITATSFGVDGLKNAQRYDFVLKAKNAAGEGQATASATADLAYPRRAYENAYNDQTDTIIRPGTGKTGEVGRIPRGQYRSITVICQLKGDSVTEADSGETSDVWDRIEWNGGVAYLSDTLMKTPRGGFPAAPLFQCDD